MDEASGMGRRQGAGHLRGQARRLAGRERAAAPEDRGDVLAVDPLHDDERALLVDAVVVDGDDVRMVERGGSLRLLAEPAAELRVAPVLGTEELDGNVAVQLGVMGPVDGGHATLAQELHEAIAAPEHASDIRQDDPLVMRPVGPSYRTEPGARPNSRVEPLRPAGRG